MGKVDLHKSREYQWVINPTLLCNDEVGKEEKEKGMKLFDNVWPPL